MSGGHTSLGMHQATRGGDRSPASGDTVGPPAGDAMQPGCDTDLRRPRAERGAWVCGLQEVLVGGLGPAKLRELKMSATDLASGSVKGPRKEPPARTTHKSAGSKVRSLLPHHPLRGTAPAAHSCIRVLSCSTPSARPGGWRTRSGLPGGHQSSLRRVHVAQWLLSTPTQPRVRCIESGG